MLARPEQDVWLTASSSCCLLSSSAIAIVVAPLSSYNPLCIKCGQHFQESFYIGSDVDVPDDLIPNHFSAIFRYVKKNYLQFCLFLSYFVSFLTPIRKIRFLFQVKLFTRIRTLNFRVVNLETWVRNHTRDNCFHVRNLT